MRIAEGLEALDIPMNVNNPANLIYPALLWDEKHAILVDTGLPGTAPRIREAMESAGVPLQKLTHVILTHQDVDHIGGLMGLLELLDHPIEVLAHEIERPYIEGEKPLIKWKPERLDAMFEALPEPQREEAKARFSAALKAKVDRTVVDGEVLPYCGGIQIVYTPGHTPGHMSLYIRSSKTLLAGDAMVAPGGQLQGPNPTVTPDMDTAMKSIGKLASLDIEAILCYHGGLVRGGIRERLAKLTVSTH
ncbi:MBL fold metallo-hydrolase [Paenibacillus sp. HJGM_3]|uniref:MBL fold metallo-hydrolase n=1 Tax=Paenibacillus sp. HJGM_3 TaxID=3379816 RepID=UPI00385D7541